MDLPPIVSLERALDDVYYLRALDDNGDLTKLGEIISEFPLVLEIAKMLVTNPKFNY